MGPITAIFENGVFRPTAPVNLPDKCEVVFEPKVVMKCDDPAHLDRVYEILSHRYKSGHHDTAERHNEHQP